MYIINFSIKEDIRASAFKLKIPICFNCHLIDLLFFFLGILLKYVNVATLTTRGKKKGRFPTNK